jgi:myo-inositol-1(or 4)-monophosphatase
MTSLSAERALAIELARTAGEMHRGELRGPRQIALKGSPTNLVTEMDARAEALIVDGLLARFPHDAILAEERGAAAGRSGRRWIIDPLDGTTNYAHGLPLYGVSIALEMHRRVELGVVFDPSQGELFVAERGAGAFCNETRLAVSASTTLDASLLATGFPSDVRQREDNNLREYGACGGWARRCCTWPGSRPVASTATGSSDWDRGTSPPAVSWWRKPADD